MISNPYFHDNYVDGIEQELLHELIIESIQIHGIDCVYVRRKIVEFQQLYDQPQQVKYEETYLTDIYLENVLGFQGDREFMSKFGGVEIRDQVTFVAARREFDIDVGIAAQIQRPMEGDIIFLPMDKRVFIVRYVDKYSVMYQLGALYVWRMTCELFEYSNEVFNTGIPDLDRIQKTGTTNILDYSIRDTDGTPLMFEDGNWWVTDAYDFSKIDPLADNDYDQQQGANTIIQWTEVDPFTEGGEIQKYL